nr:MAG TPA: hypothetical protein [Ackermannviridae sp.]
MSHQFLHLLSVEVCFWQPCRMKLLVVTKRT